MSHGGETGGCPIGATKCDQSCHGTSATVPTLRVEPTMVPTRIISDLLTTFMAGCLGLPGLPCQSRSLTKGLERWRNPRGHHGFTVGTDCAKVQVLVNEMSGESSCPSAPLGQFRGFVRCEENNWSDQLHTPFPPSIPEEKARGV